MKEITFQPHNLEDHPVNTTEGHPQNAWPGLSKRDTKDATVTCNMGSWEEEGHWGKMTKIWIKSRFQLIAFDQNSFLSFDNRPINIYKLLMVRKIE